MPRRHHYPSFTSLPRRADQSHAREQSASGASCERCGEAGYGVKQIVTKHGPEDVCMDCRAGHAEAKKKGLLDHAF